MLLAASNEAVEIGLLDAHASSKWLTVGEVPESLTIVMVFAPREGRFRSTIDVHSA